MANTREEAGIHKTDMPVTAFDSAEDCWQGDEDGPENSFDQRDTNRAQTNNRGANTAVEVQEQQPPGAQGRDIPCDTPDNGEGTEATTEHAEDDAAIRRADHKVDQVFDEAQDACILPRITEEAMNTQVDFINTTSLLAHIDAIGNSKSRYTFVNEHAIPANKVKQAIRRWRKAFGGKIFIGPLSGEAKGRSAGIAATAKPNCKIVFLAPRTKMMQDVVNAGRAASYAIDRGGGQTVIVLCIYG